MRPCLATADRAEKNGRPRTGRAARKSTWVAVNPRGPLDSKLPYQAAIGPDNLQSLSETIKLDLSPARKGKRPKGPFPLRTVSSGRFIPGHHRPQTGPTLRRRLNRMRDSGTAAGRPLRWT